MNSGYIDSSLNVNFFNNLSEEMRKAQIYV